MNKPDAYWGWTEPESAANTDYQPVYPYNNVTQTRSGHMFELDDTKGRERVRLQHRANTFIEMHRNTVRTVSVFRKIFQKHYNDRKHLITFWSTGRNFLRSGYEVRAMGDSGGRRRSVEVSRKWLMTTLFCV